MKHPPESISTSRTSHLTDSTLLGPDVEDPSARFATTLELNDARAHVCVSGDIDVATRDTLTQVAVGAVHLATVRDVVIDLSRVTFMDASGLGSLVAIRNASHDSDKNLALSSLPATVNRLLTLTSLLDHFTVAPSHLHD